MKKCIKCGSHAFNLYMENIDQGDLCDVHYWQGRAHRAEAQPAQEPVAWGFRHDDGAIYDCISPEAHADCEGEYTVPLYSAPPAAQPAQEPMHPQIQKMYEDYFDKCFKESSALDAAVLAEREACAALAQQTICDTHIPTGINIYGTRAAKAIRARGNI